MSAMQYARPPDAPFSQTLAQRAAVLFLLGLSLSACSPAAPEPLRVGVNLWPGYELLFLARELGQYEGSGIRLVEYSSDSQALRAYRNGAIDAAALTLDETLLLAQQPEHAPRIVAVLDFSDGADALLARPEIDSLQALAGRRIGVETTALGAFFLTRVLEHAGLARGDVEVVPVELNALAEAYRSGRVEAVVAAEPGRRALLAAGARELFDSRRLPGEIVDVLVVRESFLRAHPDAVRALVRGWWRAVGHLHADPADAAARMAPRTGLGAAAFRATLEGVRIPGPEESLRLLRGGKAAPLAKTARRLQRVMLENGLLEAAVPLDGLLAPEPLEAVRE